MNYQILLKNLNKLKFLMEVLLFFAAKKGNICLLKFLHENGCPWNVFITKYFAKNGYLDFLKYAYENGCPWNEYTCIDALNNGHQYCLKYTIKNGCPSHSIKKICT